MSTLDRYADLVEQAFPQPSPAMQAYIAAIRRSARQRDEAAFDAGQDTWLNLTKDEQERCLKIAKDIRA